MPNSNDPTPQPPPTPAAADLESGGGGISVIVERWKREDLLQKCSLASRALGFIFSFLAFVIMASNKHGDWRDFDHYDEYRYVVAVAILSTLYAGLQSWRQIHKLRTSKNLFSWRNLAAVDYGGDQIGAYMLISAASAAIPLTNRMREGADNVFTDASAAAISMAFFAFVSLAISSLISGYKLCNQSYI
ncbi:CASP-like protein 4B4 [Salvia miltiorrhiza]|uniref:CASP-like protein 4B4 n=1 Tax=Salvia miltiorrhiza TaxID=226208 RepID=UPI0025AC5E6D|nr:CASP-like protein 4B4 [Salvia miltiorrhiza]